MTKKQQPHCLESLRVALEAYFQSALPMTLQPVAQGVEVRAAQIGRIENDTHFRFALRAPVGIDKSLHWDSVRLAYEIEHMLPNVQVVASKVFFASRAIFFQAKELGRKGTYWVEIFTDNS